MSCVLIGGGAGAADVEGNIAVDNITCLDVDAVGNLKFGEDHSGDPGTRTDDTRKSGDLLGVSKLNAEQDILLLRYDTVTDNSNNLFWGGGSSAFNCATAQVFYTAPTSTTLTGTERMQIFADGRIQLGGETGSHSLGNGSMIMANLEVNDDAFLDGGAIVATGQDILLDSTPLQAVGAMYHRFNATPTTQSINTTYEKVTVFDTDGLASGFTVDSTTNNRITATNDGRYMCKVFVSAGDGTGGGADWDFAIYTGAAGGPTIDPDLQVRRNINAVGVLAFEGPIDLAAAEVVELWARNAAGARDLDVHAAGIVLTTIGE